MKGKVISKLYNNNNNVIYKLTLWSVIIAHNNNNIFIGIDTIELSTNKDTLNVSLHTQNLKIDDTPNEYILDKYKKEVNKFDNKKYTKYSKLQTICLLKNSKKLSDYIIIKVSERNILESKQQNRAIRSNLTIVFSGLFQYNTINQKTYEVMQFFIKKCKISNIVFSIDGLKKELVNKSNEFIFLKRFVNFISNKSEIKFCISNNTSGSYYINNPKTPDNFTTNSQLTKFLYYDKFAKNRIFFDWKRIELSMRENQKFKELFKSTIYDYLEDCKKIAFLNFGNDIIFDTLYVETQIKSLSKEKILKLDSTKNILFNLKNIYDLNFRK